MIDEPGPLEGAALLGVLNDHDVEFIVIDGFAVIAHGYLRATRDIDIVPSPDPENLHRLVAALDELEYRVLGLDEFKPDEVPLPDLENLLAGGNWVLGTAFGRLDILQFVAPDFTYNDLAEAAIEDTVYDHPIRFCGYDDLVAMKQAAGRAQDLLDLEKLAEIRGPSDAGPRA